MMHKVLLKHLKKRLKIGHKQLCFLETISHRQRLEMLILFLQHIASLILLTNLQIQCGKNNKVSNEISHYSLFDKLWKDFAGLSCNLMK